MQLWDYANKTQYIIALPEQNIKELLMLSGTTTFIGSFKGILNLLNYMNMKAIQAPQI